MKADQTCYNSFTTFQNSPMWCYEYNYHFIIDISLLFCQQYKNIAETQNYTQ